MGILGENGYENLRKMSHSTEMFWHVFPNTRWFWWWKCWAWALDLYKTDGCLDAIPFQFYRTTTIPENWVGLDWKFIYIRMGSLAAKVWDEATLWRLSTRVVPKMIVGHGWEAKLTGEVPILGRVIERLGYIYYPHTEYGEFKIFPDGCIECCGESVPHVQSVKLFE